jgi:hypothetical protein
MRSWGRTRFKGEYLGTVPDRIVEPRVHCSLSRSAETESVEFLPRQVINQLAWLVTGAVMNLWVPLLVPARMKFRRASGRVSAMRLPVISLTVGAVFCGSIWPQSATAADQSARPAAVAPHTTEQALRDAMRQIDCASLRIRTAPDGTRVVSGTVPSDAERARLVELEGRLAGRDQLVIDVDVLPLPLCRSLLAIDHLPSAELAADVGVEARLEGGGSALREGDAIRVEVKAGGHPVNLRIDYFSLDGQVLHMLPNRDQPVVTLAAGAREVFGASGGAGDAWTPVALRLAPNSSP